MIGPVIEPNIICFFTTRLSHFNFLKRRCNGREAPLFWEAKIRVCRNGSMEYLTNKAPAGACFTPAQFLLHGGMGVARNYNSAQCHKSQRMIEYRLFHETLVVITGVACACCH